MGSALDISVVAAEGPPVRAALAEAFAEVDRLDTLMSIWKPGSDILRLNDAAGQEPVRVSPDVLDVLRRGIQAGDWTGGKFDITFGALSGLWRFDAQNESDRIPDPAEVTRRLPLIDYRQVVVDQTAGTAFLQRRGMSAHLGGIGKGYAVDRVAAILRRAGFEHFLIQFGGDLLAAGLRDGRPWSVGLRDPRGPDTRIFASLALVNEAFSTSGDYERFFISGGRRYHHILDPDTGEPARGIRSVAILAQDSTTADVLSTGVFVLGPERGMALVERLPDVDAVVVTDANQVLVSSGLRDRLTRLGEPTDAP
jgi:thiamine biosynthesis lipoprotein